MRAEVGAQPGRKSEAILFVPDAALCGVFAAHEGYLRVLADAEPLTMLDGSAQKPENAMTSVAGGVEIYLPLKGLIDVEKETRRLTKELENIGREIERTEKKLANEKFISKAPPEVVENERGKLKGYEEKKAALAERLRYLAAL